MAFITSVPKATPIPEEGFDEIMSEASAITFVMSSSTVAELAINQDPATTAHTVGPAIAITCGLMEFIHFSPFASGH
jgi:hypothetical protein